MKTASNNFSDITFIGAGIATSYALLSLLEKLNSLTNTNKIVKINVLDKYPEFFLGIPYGKRSGGSVLLINSLRSFLPEHERSLFLVWLKNNKKPLIDDFLNFGGPGAKLWLQNNTKAIEANEWEDLFVPRNFFGKYISNRVKKSVKQAENKGLIILTLTTAEAIDINDENGGFKINLNSGENLYSNKIVLSIGSLPTKNIYSEEIITKKENLLLINDIYNKDLDFNFKEIENFLINRNSKETNALIIGANASGLETFYKLNDNKLINKSISNYTILSTQGVIPDSKVNFELQKKFSPGNLIKLKNENELTAKQIADAAFLDLDFADHNNIGAASTVDIISKVIVNLLSKLSKKEKEIFACKYGNNIGKRQRCAGTHYTDVISKSLLDKKLSIVSGLFLDLKKDNNYKFKYLDKKTKKSLFSKKDIHLVINCTGSINLESTNAPLLIRKLIDKKYCIPNSSNIGFKVNSNLETSKNFFIAGPLLAGNVIEDNPVWHLEHCGRIIWTSGLIGKRLI
jgi:uncharacterized NAD(P)/FAD-binding protein YdhS